MSGDCGFMAANLYARSIFGEDALANVSIEIPVDEGPDAAVTGHIRIRAKSQVCALLLCFCLNDCYFFDWYIEETTWQICYGKSKIKCIVLLKCMWRLLFIMVSFLIEYFFRAWL